MAHPLAVGLAAALFVDLHQVASLGFALGLVAATLAIPGRVLRRDLLLQQLLLLLVLLLQVLVVLLLLHLLGVVLRLR